MNKNGVRRTRKLESETERLKKFLAEQVFNNSISKGMCRESINPVASSDKGVNLTVV